MLLLIRPYPPITRAGVCRDANIEASQEESEMTESPIIPASLIRNYPHSPSTPTAARPKEPELDKWKSRVPITRNSSLVPKPLFSSTKCVVGIEMVAATTELPTSSASPPSPTAPTAEDATPTSPSPSLFPVPPSSKGVVASAVSVTSSTTLQVPNPAHPQTATSNTTTAAAPAPVRPRPVSSCYSQNTLTTVTATVASSPRTPVPMDWSSSILTGLPSTYEPHAETIQTDVKPQTQVYAPTHMERVTEEQPIPQHIAAQIQVPRLRSPSLPQDRGSRRRTVPNPVNLVSDGRGREGLNSWSMVQSSERTTYPEMSTVSGNYEGSSWPESLQKPSWVHNIPQRHEVSRSRVSDISTPEPRSYHVANKSSTSSTLVSAPGQLDLHHKFHHRPPPDAPSQRASVADSHTPICERAEQQRSGWWSDDDDDVGEEGRGGNLRGAAIGIKEKLTIESPGLRARKIKILVGASILAILIVVGVAVGVTLGMRR